MNGVRFLGGRYRLIEMLGAGGMSVVWRAHDEVLNRPVAVKMLAGRLAADQASRERIQLEARAAARLSHPHVAAVHDYGESADTPFVVMELVDGQPLDVRLANGPLPWAVAAKIGADIASALAAVHARGLVHRDVKPANVMLTVDGAKLVDFGISAVAGDTTDLDGELLGTPAYLAPERLDGAPTTPATDIYALGLLLYKVLAGHLPWSVDTTTDILHAHRHLAPAPLPRIGGLPRGVAGLCLRCLAKDPADRPTAAEVARRLSAVVAAPVAVAPTRTLRLTDLLASSLPVSSRRAGSRALRGRVLGGRVPVVRAGVGAGVLAAAMLLLGTCGSTAEPRNTGGLLHAAGANAAAPVAEPWVGCLVRYTVIDELNGAFVADLRVTNAGGADVPDWALSFRLPGGQRVAGLSAGQWRQDGSAVQVKNPAAATLAAGGAVAATLSGRYEGVNPMPTDFTLNGVRCQSFLVAQQPPQQPPVTANPGTGAGAKVGSTTTSGNSSGKSGKGKGKGKGSDDDGGDDD